MIKSLINNETLNSVLEIEQNKFVFNSLTIFTNLLNRFREKAKIMSSYASNKIEGNPLTYEQAEIAINSENRHFLKPEQEIRNYYLALEFLDKKLEKKENLSIK